MPTWRFHLQTIVLYTALTLLIFAPNLETFHTEAFGHYQGNGHKHVRGLWAGMESIAQNGYVSTEVTLINYPDFGKLFSLEQGFQWLGMLFKPFLNVVAIHNILYLLLTILAAYSAMLLATEFTKDRYAALLGGAVYGFAPTALAFPVVSGVTETAFLFPLPLVILFALRSIYRRSFWNPVWAALFFLLQGLTCWSYGIGAAVMLFILFAMVGLAGSGTWAKDNQLIRGARVDTQLIARIGVFILVMAAIAVPLFLAAKSTVSGSGAVYSRPVSIWPGWHTLRDMEDYTLRLTVANYFMPGREWLVVESWLDLLVYSPYAGMIALALAGIGFHQGTRGSRTLAGIALLFMVLSFGPYIALYPGKNPPTVTNIVYAIFWYVFPVFHVGRHSPDRFSVLFQLLLAILATSGFSVILRQLQVRANFKYLIGAGATILVLCETLFISPLPYPMPTTPSSPHNVSLWLKDHGDPGAVLDVPVYHPYTVMFRGDILMQQVYHQRPVPYNYLGVSKTVSRNPFYARVVDDHFDSGGRYVLGVTCDDAALLHEMGFAYVIYRPRLNPHRHSEVSYCLETCLGPPQPFDDVLLYALGNVRKGVVLAPPLPPDDDASALGITPPKKNPFSEEP